MATIVKNAKGAIKYMSERNPLTEMLNSEPLHKLITKRPPESVLKVSNLASRLEIGLIALSQAQARVVTNPVKSKKVDNSLNTLETTTNRTVKLRDSAIEKTTLVSRRSNQSIIIVDLAYGLYNRGESIAENSTGRLYRALELYTIPQELSYNPESNFVAIATMGRNNPFYMFTGSEDTIEFDISWYTKTNNFRDIVLNCRWLEAMTKNDGYNDRVHPVEIIWGNPNILFQGDTWLLTAAPYKFLNFNAGYKSPDSGEVIITSLLPSVATQHLVFKRITPTNRTSRSIIQLGGSVNV